MAQEAPPGCITICALRALLMPEGCTSAEIGACFFELDKRNVGYIWKTEFLEKAVEVIVKHAKLDKTRVMSIAV